MSKFVTDGSLLQGSAMPRILSTMTSALVGRTIKRVGYFCDENGAFPCIELDNGTTLLAMTDDEGNGPGSLVATFVSARKVISGETMCATALR